MIVLRRIEPQRNMRRFYALSLQPDLFARSASSRSGVGSGNPEPYGMRFTPTRPPLMRRLHFD
jgi:hypothetical protein